MRVRYASEFDHSGIAEAARRCMSATIEAEIDMSWEPLVNLPHVGRVRAVTAPDAPAWMRARRSMPEADEMLVLHTVPRTWGRLVEELAPARVIGHTVWEAEQIPRAWLSQMACVEEFWVPTRWNGTTFAATFDRPVHVIPHVVTSKLASPPPIELPSDVFVFTTVAAWDWRKRPDRTIEAFLEAFTSRDPVVLVVKTTDLPIVWHSPLDSPRTQIQRLVDRYESPPRVIVDTNPWTDEEMLGLLERADCFVSLTSSEGWGLGAFDAACRGTPVLITGWGGQVEWLGTDYPGLIPYSFVPNDHPDREIFDPGVPWAYADMSAAIDMMRDVVSSTNSPVQTAAKGLAPELRTRYSSKSVGRLIREAIGSNLASSRRTSPIDPAQVDGSVLILTPIKNAASLAEGYVDRILALERPRGGLSVAVLASDSNDGTVDAFNREFERLRATGVEARVFERDFGYHIPDGVPRWDPSIQLERRRVLALSRNHLLFAALGVQEWVLWLDADVLAYPSDLIARLVATGAEIVQPDCVRTPGGPSFDLNAWTDAGRWHLHDYRDFETVDLHAVGGTVLLVRADRHRDGLVWPAFLYGNDNPRKRRDPEALGRAEIGEIETEGLAMMAFDMGIACIGVPGIQVVHE